MKSLHDVWLFLFQYDPISFLSLKLDYLSLNIINYGGRERVGNGGGGNRQCYNYNRYLQLKGEGV